jgi:hypothetical protein
MVYVIAKIKHKVHKSRELKRTNIIGFLYVKLYLILIIANSLSKSISIFEISTNKSLIF